MASILNADKPRIKGNEIHVTYPNKIMADELLRVKSRALKHLREKLNNYQLDFKIEINEEEATKVAYTTQEKYELLKSKNEAISLLRKTFKLDL